MVEPISLVRMAIDELELDLMQVLEAVMVLDEMPKEDKDDFDADLKEKIVKLIDTVRTTDDRLCEIAARVM